ncbi:MAG: hypothetical protein H7Z14_04635 [Anaerolineae bacterium]|nr:hypothetical protein [Phycisphaerae bacterium]
MSDADTVIRTRPAITSTIAVLALLCLAIAVGRLRFIRDLPDWDLATYALIGNEMAHGEQLYSDIWDMKPPGIFASFALAEWITRGSHEWSAYLLSVIASITTTIAIYFAGAAQGCKQLPPRPILGERQGEGSFFSSTAGLWPAAIWTCVSLQPALGAYLPNTEAFINAFLATSLAAVLSRRTIIAGVALAIATLFKQVAIAPAIALATWMLFAKQERPRRVFLMLAIIPLAWIIMFTYFALTGRGELFYQTNFIYSSFYGGNVAANLVSAFVPTHLFPAAMIELLPLVLLAIVGLILCKRRSFLIALFVGAFIAVAMPGQFFEHYYQLWLIPLSLAAACALMSIKRRLAITVGSIVCIGLLILQSHWWILSPRERAAALHPATFFLNVADTGTELRSLLRDDETMFAWCDEVQLYWLANKRPPATGLWKTHTSEGPVADWLTARTLADLQANPPDLVVSMAVDPNQLSHPIGRWIAQNYGAIPNNPGRLPLSLLARNGSDLSHRTNTTLP